MKYILFLILSLILFGSVQAKESREEIQAKLDAACEVAREKKLAPLRKEYIQACVTNKEQPSREACEQFYADYGGRMGGRAPLFYDLPECVKAFEFQQGVREGNS